MTKYIGIRLPDDLIKIIDKSALRNPHQPGNRSAEIVRVLRQAYKKEMQIENGWKVLNNLPIADQFIHIRRCVDVDEFARVNYIKASDEELLEIIKRHCITEIENYLFGNNL